MGRDLSAELRAGGPGPRIVAYSHTSLIPQSLVEISQSLVAFHDLFPTNGPEGMSVAARDEDLVYKLRYIGRRELPPEVYNWAYDQAEETNLFDPSDRRDQAMVDNLRRYKGELVEGYRRWVQRRRPLADEERLERVKRLRSLGYIR